MRLVRNIGGGCCVLAFPSTVPSTNDHKNYNRKSQYKQIKNNHRTPNPSLTT
jgi:hypothetical protein